MLRKLFIVIVANIIVNQYITATYSNNFQYYINFQNIPYYGDIQMVDVCRLLKGPVKKNSRIWEFFLLDYTSFCQQVKGDYFRIAQPEEIVSNYPAFTVDKEGFIAYTVQLVNINKNSTPSKILNLKLLTKLTKEELENPMIQKIQSNLTFRDQKELFETAPALALKHVYYKNRYNLSVFMNEKMENVPITY